LKAVKPIILKLGGSVITDKSKDVTAQIHIINRLAEEIQNANAKKLVVVHGGGSFGHPIAKKYSIKEGLKKEIQKIGFSETHHLMTVLNGLFIDALILRKVPTVSIPPSSCIITQNGRIQFFNDKPLRSFLEMGFLPVLFGDTVLDTKLNFTILSGDQLVSFLAIRFQAKRIIMGVNVNGLYDFDPKVKKSAKMFKHLTLKELKKIKNKIGKTNMCDVTGGMFGKLVELLPALEHGIPVLIVNAEKPNNIYKALKGDKVKGTIIEKELS
jgi:isopentenyl phosphate kinase